MTFFGVYHQRIDDWVADRARMVMNGNVQDGIMDEKRDGNLTIYENWVINSVLRYQSFTL